MRDHYLSISGESEGLYKEKGSKFLAFAFPVGSEEEVREKLEMLRKTYYDARHHCYAYRLGNDGEKSRANDDGEPGHSAGDPILGQIKSRELTNALVVVIRYFGGTKLGVSGLINAYKTAAAEALELNTIVTHDITHLIRFSFPYEEMNTVMKLCKDLDLKIKEQGYAEHCLLDALVVVSRAQELEARLDLMQKTGSKVTYEMIS